MGATRAWSGPWSAAGPASSVMLLWIALGILSLFDPRRRSVLDRLMHTEVRNVVPLDQQGRYIREALLERQEQARTRRRQVATPAPASRGP